jgi:hypothetical protein
VRTGQSWRLGFFGSWCVGFLIAGILPGLVFPGRFPRIPLAVLDFVHLSLHILLASLVYIILDLLGPFQLLAFGFLRLLEGSFVCRDILNDD